LSGTPNNRLPQRNTDGDNTPPTDPDQHTGMGTGAGTGAGTGGGGGPALNTSPGGGVANNSSGTTAVLNTFSKIWVSGDDKGPAKIGRLTGAGTMDSAFAFDAADKNAIGLLTT